MDAIELEPILTTGTYSVCKKVYEYCEEQYNALANDYSALERENRTLRTELTRAQNRAKKPNKDLLEEENKRLRAQNQDLLNVIKTLRQSLRKLRGID